MNLPQNDPKLGCAVRRACIGVLGALALAAAPAVLAAPPTSAPSAPPATAPASRGFNDPAGLIHIVYGADWQVHPDPDYVLSLMSGARTFTLDIPDLPPHIPDMIPLGLVVNGYIDDLKKAHPGVKIDEETPPKIAKARARQLHSSWTEKNVPTAEIATLVVHGDHVFILRMASPADQLSSARNSYGDIMESLRWLK
jgi:hypothetical protein